MNDIEKSIFGIVIIIAIVTVAIIGYNRGYKSYREIEKVVDKVLNSDGTQIIYVEPDDCEECNLQRYQMKKLVKDNELAYYYVNLKSLAKYKVNDIYERLGLSIDKTKPTIAIYEDGKIKSSLTGVTGINRLYSLLKQYDLISNKKLSLNYITLSSYIEKVKQEKIIIAIGNYFIADSNSFEEILWSIADKYNVEVNFIYVPDLSQSEGQLFQSKIENFSDTELYVPSLIIVENNNITDSLVGLKDESAYVELFKNNGIIN